MTRAALYCEKYHQGQGLSLVSIKAKEFCRERQLAEAIAQRDAARHDVFRFCTGHGLEDFVSLRDRATVAEAALAAMTEDRNLWQNAHDEDCPNNAALAAERKDKAQLQYALEQSESKFPTERARVLQEAADVLSHGYANARAIVLNMIDK